MTQVFVALDYSDASNALRMAATLRDSVDGYKVGLELMWSEGPAVVASIADIGLPVFVDAKLHDIPNTVSGAAKALSGLGARYITVHATGGPEMVAAAVGGVRDPEGCGILAVTALTSLSEATWAKIGFANPTVDTSIALAESAAAAGAEGVVCSVAASAAIKKSVRGLATVTPGIRFGGVAQDDQARVGNLDEAKKAGADVWVVGRPITKAADPKAAADRISQAARQA